MSWIINSRLGLQGTVAIEGTVLRWIITAPTPANFIYGSSYMIPLVGDWNGDGIEGIGAYDPSTSIFHLKQTATGGNADIYVQYGISGDTPISWYDTYSLAHSIGDRIGLIRGSNVFLDTGLTGGNAEIYTTIDKITYYSTVSQCKYLCGNIRIHVRNESLNFIGGYNFWYDGINMGEVTDGNLLFTYISYGSYNCQIIKSDSTVVACNYCYGSTTCTPSLNSGTCSMPINIDSDGGTYFLRVTILNPCTQPSCTFSISI